MAGALEVSVKGRANVDKKRTLCARLSDESDDWTSMLLPGVKSWKARKSAPSSESSSQSSTKAKKKSKREKGKKKPSASRASSSNAAEKPALPAKRPVQGAAGSVPESSPNKMSKSASKVFPSEQLRLINNSEVLINEVVSMLSSLSNPEGLASIT